jgi:hypothetical protein
MLEDFTWQMEGHRFEISWDVFATAGPYHIVRIGFNPATCRVQNTGHEIVTTPPLVAALTLSREQVQFAEDWAQKAQLSLRALTDALIGRHSIDKTYKVIPAALPEHVQLEPMHGSAQFRLVQMVQDLTKEDVGLRSLCGVFPNLMKEVEHETVIYVAACDKAKQAANITALRHVGREADRALAEARKSADFPLYSDPALSNFQIGAGAALIGMSAGAPFLLAKMKANRRREMSASLELIYEFASGFEPRVERWMDLIQPLSDTWFPRFRVFVPARVELLGAVDAVLFAPTREELLKRIFIYVGMHPRIAGCTFGAVEALSKFAIGTNALPLQYELPFRMVLHGVLTSNNLKWSVVRHACYNLGVTFCSFVRPTPRIIDYDVGGEQLEKVVATLVENGADRESLVGEIPTRETIARDTSAVLMQSAYSIFVGVVCMLPFISK